jgi:hypothetical protein
MNEDADSADQQEDERGYKNPAHGMQEEANEAGILWNPDFPFARLSP